MCVYMPAWRQKHDSDNCCELPNTKLVGHYKTLQVTSVVSWCLSDLNRTELLCPGDPLKWSSPAMTGPNVFKTTFNLLLVMQNGTWRKRKAHSAEAWAALLVFLFLWWRKGKVWVSSSDVIAVPVINYGFCDLPPPPTTCSSDEEEKDHNLSSQCCSSTTVSSPSSSLLSP